MRASILLAAALAVCIPATGCYFDTHPHSEPAPSPLPSTSPTTTPPPKVAIDTDRTLVVSPGDGAGIFVQYATGGHWTLRWTCDTNVTGRNCPIDLAVGTVEGQNHVAVPASGLQSRDASSFRVHTVTAATLDSITFDATPGASITLSAWIRSAPMPSLVFWVSDGKLVTEPTDPVELVPTTP